RVSGSDPFDGLAFLACSGARSYEIWDENATQSKDREVPDEHRGPDGADTQLQQLQQMLDTGSGFTPAMVVVSLGGNDAGFSTIGTTCLAPGSCDEQGDLWLDNLRYVRGELNDAYDQLSAFVQSLPTPVPVVVVPYPSPLNPDNNCADVSLTDGEIAFI